jgi:hypothetical protein
MENSYRSKQLCLLCLLCQILGRDAMKDGKQKAQCLTGTSLGDGNQVFSRKCDHSLYQTQGCAYMRKLYGIDV